MKHSTHTKLHVRILSAVLALVLMAGVLPVQAAVSGAAEEDSILYNGSFDLSNVTTQSVPGWGLNKGNTNHTVTAQKNVVYGGSGIALKIEATGQSYIYTADFSVEAGATYVLSYYIRVDSASGFQYAPFLNNSSSGGGWWKDYVLPAVTEATDQWVKVSGTVTIPESVGANANNSGSKVQLGFKVYQGSGSFYLDSVSFVKKDINLDDPNLDFEISDVTTEGLQNWKNSSQRMTLQGDSQVFHSGAQSMYIHKSALAEKDYVNSSVLIPVDDENIYEFSFWMSSRNASPTTTVRLNLQPYAADGTPIQTEGENAAVYGSVASLNGGTQRSRWQKVVTRAALPEGTAYVSLRFVLTRGSAEVWLDDIFFQIVENGTDCVVYYEDFHAVDETGNISSWQHTGGSFSAQNGGKLVVDSEEGYIFDDLLCLMKDYSYTLKGKYSADIGGTAQVRFYDYQGNEYAQQRKTVPLQAGGQEFVLNFTAPSHTGAKIYIGSDQAGTITAENIAVYMTAEPPVANRNYLDTDWSVRADRENVVSSVEMQNGKPTLMIDGQPTAPYFYQRPDLNAYLQTDGESRIANSGLNLYITYGGNLYKGGCDPIWLEDGSVDYAAFDAVIYDTLAANDDALVMVNIGMFAPKWWLEQNPDHRAQAHNGSSYIALDDVSLASEKFRQEAGQVLRQLIAHMKEQNYYNRVFGLKISGGQSYEWMHWGTDFDQGPDYSAVSQEGFRTYLKNKYGTDAALQAAWGNDQVTLETATAPGWEERCASSNVYMGDVDTGSLSRNLVDWNLWLGEASADSFLYYCQIAKEETDNQIIVGGYNGYLWTSNTHDSQGKAHTAMDRVLDSPYVDWIASPIAYNERLLGQSSTYMALLDSVQAHGKLYIAEQDNRTCLANSYAGNSWDAQRDFQVGQTRTMTDTLYQQKRDFANALVNGAGLWQFDMYGGWLDDDQLYEYFADAKAEYDQAVHFGGSTTNEIAVFVGDESYAYLTAENSNMSFKLLEPMLQQQRKHLAAMGAGYDTYAMSSLLEGKVPPHKLNIVLSPFEITEQMHSAIDTYLKTNNQVVVWVYLPGISTGTELSLENVNRATGFTVGTVEEPSTLQIRLADSGHSLTEGIANTVYGNSVENGVSPMPYLRDITDVTVLGYHLDGGMPGLAVKAMGDWISVYSAAPCLDVQLLRNLMKFAGCHSYSDNPADIIYSSSNYVALHSAAAGEKTIQLPGNFSVYDVFQEKFISMNTNQINYYHQENDTHIFRLMTPNTYGVTASIESGKGALSLPGLTEVTPGQSYTLTVTPEYGYRVKSVTVNGQTAQLTDHTLLLDNISKNTDIRVRFERQQLIANGDFELGSFGGNVTGVGSVVSDSNIHSGKYSLRLNHDGTARDLVKMDIFINPENRDRQITATFWARLVSGAKTRTINTAGYCFTDNYGNVKTQYGAQYPQRDGLWRQYTETYTLPAGYSIFEFLLYTGESGTDVYIDDISISCEGQEMMVNGGLERGNFTGSFGQGENTPTLNTTGYYHNGSYGAKLSKNGTLTATVHDLQPGQDAQLGLSVWLRGLSNSYRVGYRILSGETVVSEGSWTTSTQWQQQNLICRLPAQTEDLQIVLTSENGTIYVDDLDARILPPKEPTRVNLSFTEIFSDGTWRFTAENMDVFTQPYYKIPVTIDGTEGFAVAQVISGILCVYPSFFTVYGGKVPVANLIIPEGAVLRPVDPDLGWEALPGGEPLKVASSVEICMARGKITQWNVSLGGDLTVNFYASLWAEEKDGLQAQITVADAVYTFEAADALYDASLDAYRFAVHIAAAQMTDEISVKILYKGVTLEEKSYTVQQYAGYVLADDSMSSYHPLVKEMLHYGAAAQNYFAYQADTPADIGLSDTNQAEIPTNAEQEMTVEGSVSGLRFYGASLLFRHQVAVRYYFTCTEDVKNYTAAVGEETYPITVKDDLCYVEIPGINPQNWDQSLLLTVTDQTGSTLTVAYGPMNYMIRMNQKGTENLKQLLKAMYNYHLAAKAICSEAG